MVSGEESSRQRARTLAEQALREQAQGNDAKAEQLFAEAQQIDPDGVAEVLEEHDAAHEPDARDPGTFKRDRVAQHVARETGPKR